MPANSVPSRNSPSATCATPQPAHHGRAISGSRGDDRAGQLALGGLLARERRPQLGGDLVQQGRPVRAGGDQLVAVAAQGRPQHVVVLGPQGGTQQRQVGTPVQVRRAAHGRARAPAPAGRAPEARRCAGAGPARPSRRACPAGRRRARRGRRPCRCRAGPAPTPGERAVRHGRVRLPWAMPTSGHRQFRPRRGRCGQSWLTGRLASTSARTSSGVRPLVGTVAAATAGVDRPAGVQQLLEVRARVGQQPRVQRHQPFAAQQVLEVDVEEDDVVGGQQLRHARRGRRAAAEREDAGELGQQRR